MKEEAAVIETVRRQALEGTLQCFIAAWLFNRKARLLLWSKRLVVYLGIVAPGILGLVVLAFGTPERLTTVIAALLIVQFVANTWLEYSRWDESYAHARRSYEENTRLRREYRTLWKDPPAAPAVARNRLSLIKERDTEQEIRDEPEAHFAAWEECLARRAAFFEEQTRCPICNEVPQSRTPSGCEHCGRPQEMPLWQRFRRRLIGSFMAG